MAAVRSRWFDMGRKLLSVALFLGASSVWAVPPVQTGCARLGASCKCLDASGAFVVVGLDRCQAKDRTSKPVELSSVRLREVDRHPPVPDDSINLGPVPRGRWVRLGTFPMWEAYR